MAVFRQNEPSKEFMTSRGDATESAASTMSQTATDPTTVKVNRTHRATWNYLTSLLAMVVTSLTGIITTPLIIGWLGNARYGAWKVLFDASGFLALLELGVGGSLSAMLAKAVNSGDVTSVRRVLMVGMRVYVLIALAMFAVGLAAMPFLGFLGLAPEWMNDLRWGWILVLAGMFFLPISPMRTIMDTEQRGYWNNLLILCQLLLTTALSLVLAYHGWGITGQMLAPFLAQVPVVILLLSLALIRFPGLIGQFVYGATDRETWAAFWKLNTPNLIYNLCGRISQFTDSIVLGFVMGPQMVPLLVTTQRLASLIQGQMQSVGSATWAGLAQLHFRGEHELFNRRLIELSGLIAMLSAAALVPVVVWNAPFVRLWMHSDDYYAGNLTTYLAVGNAGMLAILSFWGYCLTSTGRVRYLVPPYVFNAVLNLPLSIICARTIGVPGPLLGTFVSYAGINVWWVSWLLHKEFQTPLQPLARALLKPLVIAVPYGFGLRYLAGLYPPVGWTALVAEVSCACLGFLALSWCTILTRSERQQWIGRLRSFLGT